MNENNAQCLIKNAVLILKIETLLQGFLTVAFSENCYCIGASYVHQLFNNLYFQNMPAVRQSRWSGFNTFRSIKYKFINFSNLLLNI